MWSFDVLLSLCVLTLFTSGITVFAVSDGLWRWSVTGSHVLIAMTTKPEIETMVYVWFILLCLCAGFIYFRLASYFRQSPWFTAAVTAINYTGGIFVLFAPGQDILSLLHVPVWYVLICAGLGYAISRMQNVPAYVLEALLFLALLRHTVFGIVQYDIAGKPLYTFDGFLRYIVPRLLVSVGLGIAVISCRRFTVLRSVISMCSKRVILVVLACSFILSLLYLIPRSALPSDVFFTMLPAYHAVHSGTLLVSVMSQYGFLYLLPWTVWFLLFPYIPVNFAVGVCICAALLSGYFIAFLAISERIILRRSVYAVAAVCAFYFTVLIRYTPVSDMVSVVSTPAFTPLRFGMFIFPLWFLIRYAETSGKRYMTYFTAVSSVLFFYSFEIGTGLIAAAAGVILLYAVRQKRGVIDAMALIRIMGLTLLVCTVFIGLYTYLSARKLPDFSMYWHFAKLYGSGFLTVPMGKERDTFILMMIVYSVSSVTGVVRWIRSGHAWGLIVSYLALIGLVTAPYYTGRSMFQTVYTISLPFVLLCALWVEYAISAVVKERMRLAALGMLIVCSSVLIVGFWHGSVFMAEHGIFHPAVIRQSLIFASRGFTHWDIYESPQYMFLAKSLPAGCPLIAFDEKEFELGTALRVPPAFQYAFVYGFITTKEQADGLIAHAGAQDVCVFVSRLFLNQRNDFSYGAYRYFMGTHGKYLREIARDDREEYTLYAIPAARFAAR